MSNLVRVVTVLLFVVVVAFCVYGFLSASEAGGDAGSIRLIYGVIGAASLGVIYWLAWLRRSGTK